MVATSDSDPTGSAADNEPDATPPSDVTPTSDASESSDASSAASTRSTQTRTGSNSRTRVRRERPAVSRDQVIGAVNGVRERVAALVWIVAVVFAVILAAGALLIALEANPSNDLVEQVKEWASDLDGPFSDLFTFDGDNAIKKAALVNWGLAAVAWLVGGRIVSAIIRP